MFLQNRALKKINFVFPPIAYISQVQLAQIGGITALEPSNLLKVNNNSAFITSALTIWFHTSVIELTTAAFLLYLLDATCGCSRRRRLQQTGNEQNETKYVLCTTP